MHDATESTLLALLIAHAAGLEDSDRVMRSFLDAVLFYEAPEQPGFLATPSLNGPVIAVFTSQAALARTVGACRWFTATGADLVSLASVGHRFVIDPGSRHQFVIDPSALVNRPLDPVA